MTADEGIQQLMVPARVVGAAVDIGSNSVHVVVARVTGRFLEPLLDLSELLGLGDVVDATGGLTDEACEALIATLVQYAALARGLDAGHVTLVGTEPIRRASNQADVRAAVQRTIGEPLHVLRHEDEALLTLLGVTGGVPVERSTLVVDIGGGSSEYVIATPGMPLVAGALRTGSARLTSALVSHDPPTAAEITALRFEAARQVAETPLGAVEAAVMVGGTATNLIKLAPDYIPSDPESPVPPPPLDRAVLDAAYGVIAKLPANAITERYLVNRRRAGMLAAGAALVEAFIDRHGLADVQVSRASLREGTILARELAGDDWLAALPALCVRGS